MAGCCGLGAEPLDYKKNAWNFLLSKKILTHARFCSVELTAEFQSFGDFQSCSRSSETSPGLGFVSVLSVTACWRTSWSRG
jgi:hypothetical protein